MKTTNLVLGVVFLLSVSCAAFADRQLDREEVLQVFAALTSQPRNTWIPAGTIQATHEEYKAPQTTDPNEIKNKISQEIAAYLSSADKQEAADETQKMAVDAIPFNVRHKLSNESTMTTVTTVKYDGNRFYWEINVDSRTDSVKPGPEMAGNYMTDNFDLRWNARRIFAWDGERYTAYSLPGNHARIDMTNQTPRVVNGPLTAGLIPWGHGVYTYQSLADAQSTAVERTVDGRTEIELTLNWDSGVQVVAVLDTAKNYALVASTITRAGSVQTSRQYSDYQLVAGNWVPGAILIEQAEVGSNKLLSRDIWNITAIDGNTPSVSDFAVDYEPDAIKEYFTGAAQSMLCYDSGTVDTDQLLTERLAYAANEGVQPQNCATAALKYVLEKLDKPVTDFQLAQLVTEPNNGTSLAAMKLFAEGLGLSSRAVTTDLKGLKGLQNCQVILYFPGKKHFVVLDSIDSKVVRVIDLAGNKFYYPVDVDFFAMDWSGGVALVLSNGSITGAFEEVDAGTAANTVGAAGYSCTKLLQSYNVIYCEQVGGLCGGIYTEYQLRWGCKSDTSGSCNSSWMLRKCTSPCINDPYIPEFCTTTGEWTNYYMLACA